VIVDDIFNKVKRQFGDESGVQLTDTDIIRYVNEGQRQIVMQNEGLLEKISTSNAVKDQASYTIPTDLLILRSISYKASSDVSYYRLKGLAYQQFNEYIDGWDGTAYGSATPLVFSQFAGNIILFPTPDSNVTNGIKIFYNRTPVDVVTSSDTPDLPLLYHDALVKQCLALAYEMDEDWDAAQVKSKQLDDDVALLRGREEWKQQERYPIITIPFDDMW
jgi:hypothetical protein